MSLWLSTANRAAGWWMGMATAAMRRQQRAAVAEMSRAVTGKKAARKRKAKTKRPSAKR
ncbi:MULTISPECIES: hypothetical protein [Methylobacterium]|nr:MULTISPECIES: hypothetical protein [Methylobacterium]